MKNFSDALQLMGLGVSVVFIFLILLILAIGFMSYIVQKYFPQQPEQIPQRAAISPQQDTMIAAAVAAVHLYRNRHKS